MEYVNVDSFINLFPNITYDSDQVAQKTLDIWNSYRAKMIAPKESENSSYLYHEVSNIDTLDSLATIYYGTPKLWWLIALVNDAADPFDFLQDVIDGIDGDTGLIKILRPEQVGDILFDLKIIKSKNDSISSNKDKS